MKRSSTDCFLYSFFVVRFSLPAFASGGSRTRGLLLTLLDFARIHRNANLELLDLQFLWRLAGIAVHVGFGLGVVGLHARQRFASSRADFVAHANGQFVVERDVWPF